MGEALTRLAAAPHGASEWAAADTPGLRREFGDNPFRRPGSPGKGMGLR